MRPDPVPVAAHAFVLEAIGFYRPLGFFEGDAHLSDAALAEKILATSGFADGEIDPDDIDHEIRVLACDARRAWSLVRDGREVVPGADAWIEMLRAWGRISRGAFVPTHLVEEWEAEDGPLAVSFFQGGEAHVIEPAVGDGYIDLDVLDDVNERVAEAGYRFECLATDPHNVLVLVLTPGETERMERERGARFADYQYDDEAEADDDAEAAGDEDDEEEDDPRETA